MKILALTIVKHSPGHYSGHCEGEVSPALLHESIAATLRHYGHEIPPEFAKYVNVDYCGVQLATTAIISLEKEADRLAADLVQMAAQIYG